MKNIPSSILIVLLFGFIFISGCSKSETPSSVAEKFFKEISAKDFEAAKAYGTAETENLLSMMSGYKKISVDSANSEVKYDILRETIAGENATVFYLADNKRGEQQLQMVKENGKWKVILNKESINNSDPSMNFGATTLDSTSKK